MDPASQESQRQSTFGAALKKAADVVGHYVDFSDHSSSWGDSASEHDGADTPTQNEDLRTPLLHSQPIDADDALDSSDHLSSSAGSDAPSQQVSRDEAAVVPEQAADLTAHKLPAVSDHASSPPEGQQTPSKDDLRSTPEISQPADESAETEGSSPSASQDVIQTPAREDARSTPDDSQPKNQYNALPAQSDSPKVPPSGGLENLGSGLLDPSLLEQLLDEHAPPPDMPGTPVQHVAPVNAAENPGVQNLQFSHND